MKIPLKYWKSALSSKSGGKYALDSKVIWSSDNCNKGTSRCICEPPFYLITFPTELRDPIGRQKWTSIVNRKRGNKIWQPTSDSRVCSLHFLDGKPSPAHPYPTLHLGYERFREIKSRPPPTPRENLDHVPKKSKKSLNDNFSKESCVGEQESKIEKVPRGINNMDNNMCSENDQLSCTFACNVDHSYSISDLAHTTGAHDSSPGTTSQLGEIEKLRNRVKYLENELAKSKSIVAACLRKPFRIQAILKSDKKVKFYTGIPTLQSFYKIETCMKKYLKQMRYWKGPSKVCNPIRYKRCKQSQKNSYT